MSSRRVVPPSEKNTILEKEKDNHHEGLHPAASGKLDIAPAVPAAVIMKLLGFTAAMVGLPIGTYFSTLHLVFNGNATLAGALAAIIANVVLITYVLVAMKEDQSEQLAAEAKAKKGQ